MSRRRDMMMRAEYVSYLAETLLWRDAVVANGGTVSAGWLSIIDSYIQAEMSSGLWDITDDYCILRPEPGSAANMLIQAMTTLKRCVLMTSMNDTPAGPAGLFLNASLSRYVKTGWVQNTHAVAMSQTSMWVGSYETAETNVGYNIGANINTNSALAIRARTSGLYAGMLNSASTTLAGASTSIGLTSFNRDGSTFTFRRNGADVNTVTPAASGSTGLNIELYIGALNTGGTAGTFRTTTQVWNAWGASRTQAQDADAYTNLTALFAAMDRFAPTLNVYASSIDYGGIPLGTNAGVGIIESPLLTWDAAYSAARAADVMVLNGATASPQTYTATTFFTIVKPLKVQAAFEHGAGPASSGVTALIRVGPSNGELVEFEDILFDGAVQTSGPAQMLLYLLSKSVEYPVIVRNGLFQNWDDYTAIYAPDASLKIDLSVLDSELNNSGSRSSINCASVASGNLLVQGGSTTLTNVLNAAFPAIFWSAVADGVIAAVRDHAMTLTFDATMIGVGYSAILIENCAGTILDGDYDGTGARAITIDASAAATINAHAIAVSTDVGGTERSISDSIVRNWVITTDSYGGSMVRMGADSADRTLAYRCGIEYVIGIGSANFAAGAGHCFFLVWVIDGWIRYTTASGGSLGNVNKCTLRGEVAYTTVSDQTSVLSLHKGAEEFYDHHNTYTAIAGNNGTTIVRVQEDDVTLVPSTGRFEDNVIVVDGATDVILVDCQNDGSDVTLARNSYNVINGGTLATNCFRKGGVNYTPAEWLASVEPTATGNIF